MSIQIPKLTRRDFIRVGGLGVCGYSLLPMLEPLNVEATSKVQPRGGAEVCILFFMQGGPSQLDTFSVKEGAWTPQDFDVRTVKPGLKMPVGLLPKLANRTDKYTVIRSLEAWEGEHGRGTYYLQAGRSRSPARIQEIPSVGSVLAYETQGKAKESDFLPPFIAMNMDPTWLIGQGLLPSGYGPMLLRTNAPVPFLVPESEKAGFERRRALLEQLDGEWREQDPHRGQLFRDLDQYYRSAFPLLDNPKATSVFKVQSDDHIRYGSSSPGDACILARNIVRANAGTRFIFIAHKHGWDLHDKLYDKTAKNNQYNMCGQLDPAIAGLLDDLEAEKDGKGRRLIEKTLVVCMGEFGRTPGDANLRGGRDHYRYAAVALFAGAGVRGGQVLGDTDEKGARVTEPGWHRPRSIYPEDVLVTMYSVMGVDWTKKITQTPSGRAFEYVENISPQGVMIFDQIGELFA